MRQCPFALIVTASLWATPPPDRAADIPVDLVFILAADVSRSMDEEQQLQRDGYVTVLVHSEIVAAAIAIPDLEAAIRALRLNGRRKFAG